MIEFLLVDNYDFVVLLFSEFGKDIKNKTWTTYFVYVLSRYRQTPNPLYPSKSPRHRREHPCFYPCVFFNLAN